MNSETFDRQDGTERRRFDPGERATGRPVPLASTGRPGRLIRPMCAAAITILCSATAWGALHPQPEPEPAKEDKKLGERLIRKAVTDANEDVMATIIRLMDTAARKLELEFDAGEETQAVQQQIMDRLDDAIKVAANQRRPMAGQPRPTEGDRRKRPPRDEQADRESGTASAEDASQPAAETDAAGRRTTESDYSEFEARRAWGHLPPREREEVLQGIGEEFLERYREWIERYYRALQEAEE
jgi:hypothetical protein